jgi:hypothetical protein
MWIDISIAKEWCLGLTHVIQIQESSRATANTQYSIDGSINDEKHTKYIWFITEEKLPNLTFKSAMFGRKAAPFGILEAFARRLQTAQASDQQCEERTFSPKGRILLGQLQRPAVSSFRLLHCDASIRSPRQFN